MGRSGRTSKRAGLAAIAALDPSSLWDVERAGDVSEVAALLAVVPHMDHHWLNWIEAGVPALEDAFLTPTEREARRDSARALVQARAHLAALLAPSKAR